MPYMCSAPDHQKRESEWNWTHRWLSCHVGTKSCTWVLSAWAISALNWGMGVCGCGCAQACIRAWRPPVDIGDFSKPIVRLVGQKSPSLLCFPGTGALLLCIWVLGIQLRFSCNVAHFISWAGFPVPFVSETRSCDCSSGWFQTCRVGQAGRELALILEC